jgi:hypothetical protein
MFSYNLKGVSSMLNANRGRELSTSLLAILSAMIIGLGMFACYPGGPNSSVELTTVSTGYDKSFNFSKPNYVFLDSVVHIIDEENPDNNVDLSRDYDDTIIASVRRNMSTLNHPTSHTMGSV